MASQPEEPAPNFALRQVLGFVAVSPLGLEGVSPPSPVPPASQGISQPSVFPGAPYTPLLSLCFFLSTHPVTASGPKTLAFYISKQFSRFPLNSKPSFTLGLRIQFQAFETDKRHIQSYDTREKE